MFHCRVCLTFKDNLYPIKEYLTAFEQCTGILSENTALLCPSCIRRLCASYEFLLEALKSEEVLKLKKAVKLVEIKEELCSEDEVEEVIVHKPETDNEPVFALADDVKVQRRAEQAEETEQHTRNNEDEILIDTRPSHSQKVKNAWTKEAKENLIRNCPFCFYYDKSKLRLQQHVQQHIRK